MKVAVMILVVVVALIAAVLFDGPLWADALLLLLLVGGVAGLPLYRLWVCRHEMRFAAEMAGEELPQMQRDPDRLQELKSRWQEALRLLRASHLKKQGNPLYVLPWYLLIGPSGAGKSTALHSARLSSPFAAPQHHADVVATTTCNWWFHDDAVIIDTAGRYLNADEEGCRAEWAAFLRLLVRHRRRESLDGLIVAIPADRLLSGDSAALAGAGKLVRRRIDELMRALRVRFPVYLVVTKCDLVKGMGKCTERLPEKSLDQPMGVLNDEPSADVAGFVESSLATIGQRLSTLRLQLLIDRPPVEAAPELLMFPGQFGKMRAGLLPFMLAAFGANSYQETPLLRGLFFSAQRQGTGGTPNGHGLFLHDLLAKILPQDRWIYAPTGRAVQWRQVTGNWMLVCWSIVGIAMCGLLSFSFAKNVSTLSQISRQLQHGTGFTGNRVDLSTLQRCREGIVAVERKNRGWWMPRLGLTESMTVEGELKKRFCRIFHDGFLASFDREIGDSIAVLSPTAADEEYGEYVLHLARRINLLKARQAGERVDTLERMPQPPGFGNPGVAAIYVSYLSWRDDPGAIATDMALLQSLLQRAVAVKGGDMRWLVSWVDRRSGIAPVTVADFWGGSLQSQEARSVPPRFTARGKREIESLPREIEAALPDHRPLVGKHKEFDDWYRIASLASWQAFVAAFPAGSSTLKGERQWRETAAKIAAHQGPYADLTKRMMSELAPQIKEGESPRWLRQLCRFQLISQAGSSENRTVRRAADGGKKLLASLKKKAGEEGVAQQLENEVDGADAYRDYLAAVAAIAPAMGSRSLGYQSAVQVYGEETAAKSSFSLAGTATQKVKYAVAAGDAPDETAVRLIDGPLDFLWRFVRQEAGAYLQSQWEEQVLSGTAGLTGNEAAPVLLGPDGLAWRFVKGPAAPFLNRTIRGYRAKEALGGTVQFEPAFLSFLERGNRVQAAALAKRSSYSVGIQGLPTDANREARIKPHATRLELQCGGSAQSLVNHNFPVGKTFNWSPDNCGDVTLQIEVGDLVLTQRFMGPQGFPEFLQSFQGGRRTFLSRDFPGERNALEKMGIRFIKVNYNLSGSAAVIKQASSGCGDIPRSIARSWSF